jgi:hypothetical protein
MNVIEDLKDVIRIMHGVESTHVESVPVKEVFQGKTVWEGVVVVLNLHGPPPAKKTNAWTHATDDPANPKRHVTVLHIPPAVSPITAVRSVILQELRANADIEAEA